MLKWQVLNWRKEKRRGGGWRELRARAKAVALKKSFPGQVQGPPVTKSRPRGEFLHCPQKILGLNLFVAGGAEQELQRATSSGRQRNSWTSG